MKKRAQVSTKSKQQRTKSETPQEDVLAGVKSSSSTKSVELPVIPGNLYDFPKYYDLIFGSDWQAEYQFLLQCIKKYGRKPTKKLLELGCGTGRLMIKLAQAGYQMSGIDLNPHALKFCNDRLKRHNFPATAQLGDMGQFQLKHKVDLAYNMINTFRHLPTEESAINHFKCVADSLNSGGLYILGLHLTPLTAQRCQSEKWSASRGNLTVNSHLWSKSINAETRQEIIGMSFDVYTPTQCFRILDETIFRSYTAAQMAMLLLTEVRLEPVGIYDFRYEIDQPAEITPQTEDVIYVFRKR